MLESLRNTSEICCGDGLSYEWIVFSCKSCDWVSSRNCWWSRRILFLFFDILLIVSDVLGLKSHS